MKIRTDRTASQWNKHRFHALLASLSTQEVFMRTYSVLALVLMLGIVGITATACNTVEGVGEDVTSAGKAIDKAAE
ncbi:entericidin A/B family lipoprotein [Aquisediminimonas sediminicola]|uniref:entericidin A/B family lipoprotein n=1 Tax=Alteraquisediminimonas sediminicola TaxID=2676787 RepID=UPI003CCEF806